MDCNYCKYYQKPIPTAQNLSTSMCQITHVCNPKSCSLENDDDVADMEICFNCEYWIGGGDWGLSCMQDYYNCNTNGFEKACPLYRHIVRDNTD